VDVLHVDGGGTVDWGWGCGGRALSLIAVVMGVPGRVRGSTERAGQEDEVGELHVDCWWLTLKPRVFCCIQIVFFVSDVGQSDCVGENATGKFFRLLKVDTCGRLDRERQDVARCVLKE
jgi:hypothetical protein